MLSFVTKLSDHTALGFWSFSDEIAARMGDDPGESFEMVFVDVPGGDLERWPVMAVLHACAGLTSYQELVDDWCFDIGVQVGEQIEGED